MAKKQPAKILFAQLNQRKIVEVNGKKTMPHRNACAIYSCAINMYYNCWIKIDVDYYCDDLEKKWLFHKEYWWKFLAIFNYIYYEELKKHPKLKKNTFFRDTIDFYNIVKEWYLIRIWISVNRSFYDDVYDAFLNEDNYEDFVWDDIQHATNIWQWIKESDYKWKNFIYDSYAFVNNSWFYENLDLSQLKLIQMPTCYMYYLEE